MIQILAATFTPANSNRPCSGPVVETKTMSARPTPEQIAALQAYAARNGRTWKSQLNEAWRTGRDEYEPEGYRLRQVRNEFGPTWLFDKFRLPKTA